MPLPMTYYERNLPHWQPEGKAIFVTWRLWGSLPTNAWTGAGNTKAVMSAGKRFAHIDRKLDTAARGPKWLSDDRVAGAVITTLRRGEITLHHYLLHAWVILPNHMHILIEPQIDPVQALKGIKGTSARVANRILCRTGHPFWQDESFDHWVRNAAEFEKVKTYIEQNPVMAGLARTPQEWPWSSASLSERP